MLINEKIITTLIDYSKMFNPNFVINEFLKKNFLDVNQKFVNHSSVNLRFKLFKILCELGNFQEVENQNYLFHNQNALLQFSLWFH